MVAFAVITGTACNCFCLTCSFFFFSHPEETGDRQMRQDRIRENEMSEKREVRIENPGRGEHGWVARRASGGGTFIEFHNAEGKYRGVAEARDFRKLASPMGAIAYQIQLGGDFGYPGCTEAEAEACFALVSRRPLTQAEQWKRADKIGEMEERERRANDAWERGDADEWARIR